MRKIRILNIDIDNISQTFLLENIKEGIVFTPNADHLMKLQKDREFYEVYKNAAYIICDSQIIYILSKFLGTPLKEKISGSDFFPAFYNYNKNNGTKIFLLGAAPGVAETAQRNINLKVNRGIVVGTYSPKYGFENDPEENETIINKINESEANVLAVGLGAPKQEKWIVKNRHRLKKINIVLAIGAVIDFEAGVVKRAPKVISSIGLEWLYRIMQEPRRLWKRYFIEDTPLLLLLLKQKTGKYINPFG